MKIEFTKMTGAGNDFVVIDNRSRRITNGPRAAKQLCDRRWGIGADGLLLLERSRKADYRMMYYNADGSYGGMCGNGGRCIALYAVRNRIAPAKHSIEALDYVYKAVVKRDSVTLWMKKPKDLQINASLRLQGRRQLINFVDTGSPHAVVPINTLADGTSKLEELDAYTLGRRLRYHPHFAPKGTNANFVQLSRDKSVKLRTYERGVESETLACGTGSIAAAIVAYKIWDVKPPVKLIPRSGVPLIVNFRAERGEIEDVRLTGPAQFVFRGAIELDLKIFSRR
ncbi:MAG: diaminopimelate epimerase [Bacteroidota bacterium]